MRFIDLLVKEMDRCRDTLLGIICEPNDRAEFYRDLLSRRWLPLPPEKKRLERRVFAVDSSDGVIELAGGGVVYVVRAVAFSNRQKVRTMRVNAFYPPASEELEEYRRLSREHQEHMVALEAVETLSPGDAVLIDGSIFGRMLHIFRSLDIPDEEVFMLDYVELFHQLLETCLNKGITLIGVAKDSRSALLRENLLIELLLKNMEKQDEKPAKMVNLLRDLRRRRNQALKTIRKLVNEVDEETGRVLRELTCRMPDYKMIISTRQGAGYSHPLKMEFKAVESGFIDALYTPDKRDKLAESFLSSLPWEATSILEKKVRKAFEHMASYPAVATLYVRFSRNDIPLRVDVVHPKVERWSVEAPHVRFAVGDWKNMVHDVLGLLGYLYAGLRNYNVLLTSADRYVKMTMDARNAYKLKIESFLGMLIEQSRGVRRVSFP